MKMIFFILKMKGDNCVEVKKSNIVSIIVDDANYNIQDKIFDWRKVQVKGRAKNYVSEVRNQGRYETCWSFASVGSIESTVNIFGVKGSNNEHTEKLSPKNMYFCNEFEKNQIPFKYNHHAVSYVINNQGSVKESDDPYKKLKNGKCKDGLIPAYSNRGCKFFIKDGYPSIDEIKSYVLKCGPLISAMEWSNHCYTGKIPFWKYWLKHDEFTYCIGQRTKDYK